MKNMVDWIFTIIIKQWETCEPTQAHVSWFNFQSMEKSCSSVRYCQFISLGLELHVHVCRSKSKFELDKSSYQLFIVICLQIPHVYCTTLITNNKLTLRIYKISSLSFHLPTSTLQVTDSMLCYPIIVSKMDGLFSNHNSKRQTKLQLDHTLVDCVLQLYIQINCLQLLVTWLGWRQTQFTGALTWNTLWHCKLWDL